VHRCSLAETLDAPCDKHKMKHRNNTNYDYIDNNNNYYYCCYYYYYYYYYYYCHYYYC